MQVFLEGKPGVTLHMWEGRHREFGKRYIMDDGYVCARKKYDLRRSGMNSHHIPYFLCAALCFVLFFAGLRSAENINMYFAVLLGAVLAGLCILIFVLFRKPDEDDILKTWRHIQQTESNETLK